MRHTGPCGYDKAYITSVYMSKCSYVGSSTKEWIMNWILIYLGLGAICTAKEHSFAAGHWRCLSHLRYHNKLNPTSKKPIFHKHTKPPSLVPQPLFFFLASFPNLIYPLCIMDSSPLVNGCYKASEMLYSDPSRPWIIQKFGGTSIGKFVEEIVEQVVK